jgi:hypothetical protein
MLKLASAFRLGHICRSYERVPGGSFCNHAGGERQSQLAINDDAQRIATVDESHCKPGIISNHRSYTDQYRVMLAPEFMRESQ